VRHLGHVTSIDEDGVALAAIKALQRDNGELLARSEAIEATDSAKQDALRAELQRVESADALLYLRWADAGSDTRGGSR
jgi:hypothetical protein